MQTILVLTPDNKEKPTKLIDEKGNAIKSYQGGFRFFAKERKYDDFHRTMDILLKKTDCFIVLGTLTDYGIDEVDQGHSIRRLKKDKKDSPATIRDKNSKVIALDLDDIYIEDWNPNDPEPQIKQWMNENEIFCDVTWQITSSQKLHSNNARIRLYLEASRSTTLGNRKAWASTVGADTSVFSCCQPIYTAPPIFEKGCKDFIKKRHGFIKGKYNQIMVPEYNAEELKNIKTLEYSGYDFMAAKLPDDVISGKVHRRYFRGLALHYMNLVHEVDAVYAIINAKISQLPENIRESRGNSQENIMEYVKGAYERIKLEEEQKTTVDVIDDFVDDDPSSYVLKLDSAILAPDNAFGDLVREIDKLHWIPNLMISSVVARMAIAHASAGLYKSEIGDRINIQTVIVGESGCGKDIINGTINLILTECFDSGSDLLKYKTNTMIHKVASMEGVEDMLFSCGNYSDCLMIFDEFGGLLDKSKKNPKIEEMFEDLMRAYTWSSESKQKRVKAKQKDDDSNKLAIYSPHISLLGATTKALLLPSLEMKYVGTGLASRLMLIPVDNYAGNIRRKIPDSIRLSDEIISSFRLMSDMSRIDGGQIGLPYSRLRAPLLVELEPGVTDLFYDLSVKDRNVFGPLRAIWNRRAANAKKIAMAEAIMVNPAFPLITHDMAKRAEVIATHSCTYTAALYKNEVGDSDLDKAAKQIMRRLAKKPDEWWTRSAALNTSATNGATAQLRESVLSELEKGGFIETMVPKGKRAIMIKMLKPMKD